MKKLKHTVARVKEAKENDRARFRLTNYQVDRHGEVVIPDGIILKEYKQNPVVLFGHGFREDVPIGKIDISSFKITKNYVDADILFDMEDEFAVKIAGKVKNGFLNTGSIGFRPKVIDNEPVLPKQTGVTIKEWELFEFSVVPIPSNVGATALREWKDELKEIAPDLDDSIIKNLDMAIGYIEQKEIDVSTDDYTATYRISEIEEVIEKAGRVLSSKNRTLVKNVHDSMETLLNELKTLLDATEPKDTDEEVSEEKYVRHTDAQIKKVLDAISAAKLINNINDLKRIV